VKIYFAMGASAGQNGLLAAHGITLLLRCVFAFSAWRRRPDGTWQPTDVSSFQLQAKLVVQGQLQLHVQTFWLLTANMRVGLGWTCRHDGLRNKKY
jgi:hypothetical protein